ncbi:MAG: ice-binding family protein [Bacteroidia bacterium]
MKNKRLFLLALVIFFYPKINYGQAPNLGTAAGFVLFTSAGAVTNTGISQITGHVGSNLGANTNFGNVNGAMHTQNAATAACSTDVLSAYNQLDGTTTTATHSVTLGGDTLLPGVFEVTGASTLNNTLTLNAQGNPNSVFIFKLQGAFSATANAKVKLINGALACNVFWKIEGLTSLATGVTMRGTIITNNAAIIMSAGDTLEGRAFTTAGAISVDGILAYTPLGGGSPVLSGPTPPILGTTENYVLFTGIGALTNTGATFADGDIGSNSGLTTGFIPANINGTIHATPDASTGQCATDLATVYTHLSTLSADIELLYPAQFGNNLVLTPHTYLLNAATTFTDTIFFNAQGNPDAIFVIKIYGALNTSTYSNVVLLNGTQSKNVFWLVSGAVSISEHAVFRGTLIVNNAAISFGANTILDGSALTNVGALSVSTLTAIPDIQHDVFYSQGSGNPVTLSNWNSEIDGSGYIPASLSIATSYIIQNSHTLTTSGTLLFGTAESMLVIQNGGILTVSSGNHITFDSTSILQIEAGALLNANTNQTTPLLNMVGGKLNIASGISVTLNGAVTTTAGVFSGSNTSNLIIGTEVGNLLFDQTILGTTNVIHQLIIGTGNAASLTIGNVLNICPTGKISFHALGTKSLTIAGQNLTLLSTNVGSAMIDNTNNATIIGNIIVQNYLPANGRKYRFLASPVIGGTTLQWRNDGNNNSGEGIAITGPTGTVDASISNQPSAFYYLESNVTEGTNINGASKWPNLDGSTTLMNGKGYRVFVRGDRTISLVTSNTTNNATTIFVKGTYPGNPVSPTMTYTTAAANGWNLVGNPYPCTIDWGAVTAGDRTNLDNAVYIWHPTNTTSSSGGYASYVNGIGTGTPNAGTQYISSGQAFFVKANAASPVLNIRESHKSAVEAGGRIFKSSKIKSNSIRVHLMDEYKQLDDAVIYFEEGASKNFDGEFDAFDLTNYIGFLSANGKDTLAISGNPMLESNEIYKINANLGTGNFKLQFSNLTSFTSQPEVYLIDNYLNKNVRISENAFYAFSVEENNPYTFGKNRFELQLLNTGTAITETYKRQEKLFVYPNPATNILNISVSNMTAIEDINIYDTSGKLIISSQTNNNQIDISKLTNGVYMIEVFTINGKLNCKFIK